MNTLKLYFSFCLLFLSLQVISQNISIKQDLKKIFLEFEIEKKPLKIEHEYRVCFDDGGKIKVEKNKIHFTKHPVISGFKKGEFNVYYFLDSTDLFDSLGLYTLKMSLFFENISAGKEEYSKLVEKFKYFGTIIKTISTRGGVENKHIKSYKTIFNSGYEENFPRLTITYNEHGVDFYNSIEDTGLVIIIEYHSSWKDNAIYGIKFFDD